MTNLTSLIKSLRDIMRNDSGINGDAQRIEQIIWLLFLKVYDAKEATWDLEEDDYQSILPADCRWAAWAHDDGKGTALTGEELLHFVNDTLFPTLRGLPVTRETPIRQAIVQTIFAEANQYMKDGVLLRQVVNVIDGIDLDDYAEIHALGDIYENILRELQSAGSAGEFYTPRAVTDFMAAHIEPHVGERVADFACGTGGFLVSWLKQLQGQEQSAASIEAIGQSTFGIEKKQFPYMLAITNMLLHGIDAPHIVHANALTKNVLDYTEADAFDKILMNPPYGGHEKADVQGYFPEDLRDSETADLFLVLILYRLRQGGRAAVVLPDGFLFGSDNTKVNIKRKLLTECNLHTVIRLPASVFAPYTSITTNLLFFDKTGPTKETWFYRLDMPEGYKHFSKTKPMQRDHFASCDAWWDKRQVIPDPEVEGAYKANCYTRAQIEAGGYNLDLCGYPTVEEEILSPEDTIRSFHEQRAALNAKIDARLAKIADLLGIKEQ
ncbi:MAG: class I SAM-dependent DNA methyltransferase [Selenomonadaceae bacterium]|nr:type I restriction-modification system subunit M [Selenomonadaceae bacterium]MDY3915905.1 class I SAM-dependent DNA methyltransferase [Selenomonadaceae bacterium]